MNAGQSRIMFMTKIKKFLFELSGEHPELPYAELNSVLESFSRTPAKQGENLKTSKISNRLAVVDLKADTAESISKTRLRLGMCRSIHEILISAPADDLDFALENLGNNILPQNSTFKVITRCINKKNKWSKNDLDTYRNKVVKRFSGDSQVDIKHPDNEIVIYLDNKLFLTKKLFEISRSAFETRKPQFRPYFAPISLHPRLARCLVNLAGLRESEVMLDPFCGTGGILIEAGLMGMDVIGSDIDFRMVSGTKANLEYEGINGFRIFETDVADLHKHFLLSRPTHLPSAPNALPSPHAIVTEPPYGRASTTQGRSLSTLLKLAFEVFSKILPTAGRVVISLPEPKLAKPANNEFELLNKFTFRVHKSLTKTIFVFQLKN